MGFEQKVAKALQSMPENKMTKEIIIPLLESLGFEKVEFFGGVSEEGKDIVCWERDRMGDLRLIVAQVKHFKFSNKASDTQSFQTIVNQLTTCFCKPLPYTDQTVYYPSEAYLVTTHVVETKTLLTRFSNYPDLRDKRIKVIDGLQLATLLIKNLPGLVNKLMGIEAEVSSALKDSLTNDILLKSLGFSQKKDIKNIYTDIDFSLGKITTQLFFRSEYNPTFSDLSIPETEWQEFKRICLEFASEFSLEFLDRTLEDAENEFSLKLRTYDIWRSELQQLKFQLSGLQEEKRRVIANRNDLIASKTIKYENFKNGQYENFDSYSKETASIDESITSLSETIATKENEHHDLKLVISEHVVNEPIYPQYQIELNGHTLATLLMERRQWIESQVKDINDHPSVQGLKTFIKKCKSIIDSAAVILSNHQYFNCLNLDTRKAYRKEFESTRFKLPIHLIFDSGENIGVFGEAGAGKSTSLQVYALNNEGGDKLTIYIPLAYLTQHWLRVSPELSDAERIENFHEGIAKYLAAKGISISSSELDYELKSKKIILLLDSIDEAIKVNPWLPKAIKVLGEKYKSTLQLIISSRMSGNYLEEIPFFSVTLLPFTSQQRNVFIEKWFGEENSVTIQKIQSHLKKNKPMSDIITNPLLTTTLCVLAKNDVDLPNTEIKLYNSRLQLLTGYYDRVKNIDSRTLSTPQVLEFFAQKIAYYLHSENKRDEDKDVLEKQVLKIAVNQYSMAEAINALEELIDPCNILVPMTDDGQLGFGHLRYQEHLVAKELHSNRGLKITQLLKNPWWHGALKLFAQMNSSLMWLIKDLAQENQIKTNLAIVKEMIATRPKRERDDLSKFVEAMILQHEIEEEFPESLFENQNVVFLRDGR